MLGSWVETFTLASFLECTTAAVASKRRVLVGNHNINSLAVLHRGEPGFASFYAQMDHCFVDGMGVVLLAKLEGRSISAANRLAVLDWIWPLLKEAESRGWHVVHLGSSDLVAARAARAIRAACPQVRFTSISGFFDASPDSADNEAVLKRITELKPDLLLIGMGMPRQENWIVENLQRLPECPVITVGGIVGFLGDERPTAPRIFGRLGVEWLFRLASEPRRLWRRYLLEPIVLAQPVLSALRSRVRRHLRTT